MKLEWHKDTKEDVTWDEALEYCESLGDGWRLPTSKELVSVVDHSKSNPATDVEGFKSSYYWSSTIHAGNNGDAWRVHFYYGDVNYYNKHSSGTRYARAVREVKS